MKKTNVITDMKAQIVALQEAVKGKKESKEDETVCPVCAGDLEYVEEGVVYCPKCKEYYEVDTEEE